MDILIRGKYVITDAGDGEEGILTDGAITKWYRQFIY